jgi:hypothetical protein
MGALAGIFSSGGQDGYSLRRERSAPRATASYSKFLVGEDAIDGPGRGLFTAVDTRDGTVTNLPWLSRFAHGGSAVVPTSTGRMAVILTEDDLPGESQLYLFLAENDAALLEGRGQLLVFRADPGPERTRLSSRAARNAPLKGTFVPIATRLGNDWAPPDRIEDRAQAVGCMNFVRLRGAVPDRSRANVFYFADAGAGNFYDPRTARLVTGAGRVYRAELDPFDPTRVVDLRVILDGDDGDDLYGPDGLAADSRYLWIQEDPGACRPPSRARICVTTWTRTASRCWPSARAGREGEDAPQGGRRGKRRGSSTRARSSARTWLISVQANQNRPIRGTSWAAAAPAPARARLVPPSQGQGKLIEAGWAGYSGFQIAALHPRHPFAPVATRRA